MKTALRPPLSPALTRFLRYCTVGAFATVVDFGVLWLLTARAGWHPLAANPLSFLLGVTAGFCGNRYWTFAEARESRAAGQYVRFVLVNLVGVGLDQTVLAAALALGPPAGLSPELSLWTGKMLSVPFVVAWNYTANCRWTFRRRHAASTASTVPAAPVAKSS